jgi:uncharacterized protein YegL
MAVKILFADESLLNVDSVPEGWLWIDLADALIDIGEITQIQYEYIYQHDDAEKLASGTLKFIGEKIQQSEEGKHTPPLIATEQIKKNIPEPRIPVQSKIAPRSRKVVTHQIYQMRVICSKNGKEWEAILASDSQPITNSSTHKSLQVTNSLRIHLILDDSGSMRENNAMGELKHGVSLFLGLFKNAQVGIRWFNSPSLAIRPIGNEHEYILQNGKAKYGNEHAQSLLDLVDGKGDSRAASGDIVIMFTDGKPNGKGINVIEAADKVKHTGARIITIGCGDSESEFMIKISSPGDHHQIEKVTDIAKTFTTVGRSLAQNNMTPKSSFKSHIVAPAKQLQHREYDSHRPISSISSTPNLDINQGFDYIGDFCCYFCQNELRIICSQCSMTHCGGGLLKPKRKKLGGVPSKQFKCTSCGSISEIEMSDGVFGNASKSSSKKGN